MPLIGPAISAGRFWPYDQKKVREPASGAVDRNGPSKGPGFDSWPPAAAAENRPGSRRGSQASRRPGYRSAFCLRFGRFTMSGAQHAAQWASSLYLGSGDYPKAGFVCTSASSVPFYLRKRFEENWAIGLIPWQANGSHCAHFICQTPQCVTYLIAGITPVAIAAVGRGPSAISTAAAPPEGLGAKIRRRIFCDKQISISQTVGTAATHSSDPCSAHL